MDDTHPMKHLTLRRFNQQDRERLVECLNTPQVMRFLSSRIPQPYTLSDADFWINEGSRKGIIRAIDIDGLLVGCIGAEPGVFEYQHAAEVGYWLAPAYWGQGIATQALLQLLALVRRDTQLVRLHATVYEGNIGSCKVLEKCGFEAQGYYPMGVSKAGQYFNTHIYGKLLRAAHD